MLITRAAKALAPQGSRVAAKKALGSAGEMLALFCSSRLGSVLL
jgi:hypothetical protein